MNCRKKNKKKRQRPGSIDLNIHKQPTQLRKAAKPQSRFFSERARAAASVVCDSRTESRSK
jgi:hypothetical protein